MGNLPLMEAFAAREAAEVERMAAIEAAIAAAAGMGDNHAQHRNEEDAQLDGSGGRRRPVNEAGAVLAHDAAIEIAAGSQRREEPLLDSATASASSSDSPDRPDLDANSERSSNVDSTTTARVDLGALPSAHFSNPARNYEHGPSQNVVASLKRDDEDSPPDIASSTPDHFPDAVHSLKMEEEQYHGSTDHSSFIKQEDTLGSSFASEPIDVVSSNFKQEYTDRVKQEQPDAALSLTVEQPDTVYSVQDESRHSNHVMIPSSRPKKRRKKQRLDDQPPPIHVAGRLKDPPVPPVPNSSQNKNDCNSTSPVVPFFESTTEPRAHGTENGVAAATTARCSNFDDPFLMLNTDCYISHYEDDQPIYAFHSEQRANVSQPQCGFDTSYGGDACCYEDGQKLGDRHSQQHARQSPTRGDGGASFFMDSKARVATDNDDNDAKMPASKEVARQHFSLDRAATTTRPTLGADLDELIEHSCVASVATPSSAATTLSEAQNNNDDRARNGTKCSLEGFPTSPTSPSLAAEGTYREGRAIMEALVRTEYRNKFKGVVLAAESDTLVIKQPSSKTPATTKTNQMVRASTTTLDAPDASTRNAASIAGHDQTSANCAAQLHDRPFTSGTDIARMDTLRDRAATTMGTPLNTSFDEPLQGDSRVATAETPNSPATATSQAQYDSDERIRNGPNGSLLGARPAKMSPPLAGTNQDMEEAAVHAVHRGELKEAAVESDPSAIMQPVQDESHHSNLVMIPSSLPKKRRKRQRLDDQPPPIHVAGRRKDPPVPPAPNSSPSKNDGNSTSPVVPFFESATEPRAPGTENGVAAATTAGCRNLDDPFVLMNTDCYISHYEDGQPIYAFHSKQGTDVAQPQCDFDTSYGGDACCYENGQSLGDRHSEQHARQSPTRGDGGASFFMDSEARVATDNDDNDAKMPANKEVARQHFPLNRAATTTRPTLGADLDELIDHSRAAIAAKPSSAATTLPKAQRHSDDRACNGPKNCSLAGAPTSSPAPTQAPDRAKQVGCAHMQALFRTEDRGEHEEGASGDLSIMHFSSKTTATTKVQILLPSITTADTTVASTPNTAATSSVNSVSKRHDRPTASGTGLEKMDFCHVTRQSAVTIGLPLENVYAEMTSENTSFQSTPPNQPHGATISAATDYASQPSVSVSVSLTPTPIQQAAGQGLVSTNATGNAADVLASMGIDLNPSSYVALDGVTPADACPIELTLKEYQEWSTHFCEARTMAAEYANCPSMASTVASFEKMFWRDSPDGIHFSVEDSVYVTFVTLYMRANLIGNFVSPGKALLVRRITLALVEKVILRSREGSTLQDDGYQWKVWMSGHGTIRCIPSLFASKDLALHAYRLAKVELKSNSAPADIFNAECWNMFPTKINRQVAKTCVHRKSAETNRAPREVSLTDMETDRRAPNLRAGIVMDTDPFSFALEAVEPCPSSPFDIMYREWREWQLFFHACRHQAAEMVTCPSMASVVQAIQEAWASRPSSFHGLSVGTEHYSVDYTLYHRHNLIGKFESAGKALLARYITRDLLEQQYISTGCCKRWIVKVSINGYILGSNGRFSSRDQAVHAYRLAKEELKTTIHVASDLVALQAFLDQVFSNVVGPSYWVPIGHR